MVTTHDNDHHLVQGSRQAYHWSSAPPPVTPPWSRHAALAALPGDTCPQHPLASVHQSRHYVKNQTWRTTHVACWSLSQHHVRQSNLQDNKHGFRASITSVCVQSYLWCDTNMAAVLLSWSNVWGVESALSQTAVKAQMVMPLWGAAFTCSCPDCLHKLSYHGPPVMLLHNVLRNECISKY